MARKLDISSAVSRLNQVNEAIEEREKKKEKTDDIPLDSIELNKDNIFNDCDSEENIAELAQNLKENGLLHNIVVLETAPKKYLLISGERRYKAARYLGWGFIRATIKKELSDLEVLKLLFFANSETREYSIEEKIHIIKGFTEKIKKFEKSDDREAASKFGDYVAQAFNINKRQANKLISISSDLIEPLKELLFSGIIGINDAAALSQLPESYQENAIEIIKANLSDDETNNRFAIEQALDFAKRAKNVISKTNTLLAKQKTSLIYKSGRLTQAQKELNEIHDNQDAESAERIIKLEKDIVKYNTDIEQLDKEIGMETQKQDSEVAKIYSNTFSSVKKGVGKVTGEVEQAKMVEGQIHKVESGLKKLKTMKPTKEIDDMFSLLEQYKKMI